MIGTKKLAIYGGKPVSQKRKWPKWPQSNQKTEAYIKKVLKGERWSIGKFDPKDLSFNEIFCEKFSEFNSSRHVLTLDHGSNAILVALQALGITKGDEVIVPSLTWVSCATAVLRANATPILVDVEPASQCMSPYHTEQAITSKTKAILMVHLHSCMANVDAFLSLAEKYNLFVIEDCSQAHGAEWNGKKAGTFGTIGVFSTEQSKLLTSGEGGILTTEDGALYEKMFLLNNDGRRKGKYYLEEDGSLIGANFALTEFQSAILCAGLEALPAQNAIREENASYLAALLKEVPGVMNISPYNQNNKRAYFHFNFRIDRNFFNNKNISQICAALTAELGFWVKTNHQPINNCKLFHPKRDQKYNWLLLPNYASNHFQESIRQFESTVLIHHSILLAKRENMEKIYQAVLKVQQLSLYIDQ